MSDQDDLPLPPDKGSIHPLVTVAAIAVILIVLLVVFSIMGDPELRSSRPPEARPGQHSGAPPWP
jgi:hypothetical protein